MRKKSEMQKANEEFVKTYDDSKYPKPSVTADIVIFGMFDKEEDNYRKIAEKELKVLLIQRGAAPYEGCYALPGGFVGSNETIGEAAERELKKRQTATVISWSSSVPTAIQTVIREDG